MPIRPQRSLAAIFVLVALVCARLGFWQLDRLRERRAENRAAATKRSLPVVILDGRPWLPDSSLIERRVAAVGRYDYAREIVIRNQVLNGVPGIQVVTPLAIEGTDTVVLVNRGFVPAPDGLTAPALDSLRDEGRVRIDGLALPIENRRRGQPITRGGRTSWARLDFGGLRERLPYPIREIYVQRMTDQSSTSGFPRALPVPVLDDGPHLNYALQWFGFTIVALVFSGVMWRKQS